MNVLCLVNRYYHDCKTSHGRVLYAHAVARQPGVKLQFWGPGWDGYDETATLPENLARVGGAPEVVWSYKGGSLNGRGHARAVGDAAPVRLVTFNEANDRDAVRAELEAAAANAAVFHHESDFLAWAARPEAEGVNGLHLPHGADRETFYAEVGPAWHARPTACLVTGTLNPVVYPLRCRWARLVADGRIPGKFRPHPGLRMPNLDATRRQLADYASELQHAKVALVCSSIHRYALQKYAEAAAAGCVLLGDVPNDRLFRESLGRYVVSVPDKPSDDALVMLVQKVLADAAWVQARAEATQRAYLTCHTTDHYAGRLVMWLKELLGICDEDDGP